MRFTSSSPPPSRRRAAILRSAGIVAIFFLIFTNHELSNNSNDYENEIQLLLAPNTNTIADHLTPTKSSGSTATTTTTLLKNDPPTIPTNSENNGYYFNLSCPFEMSKFSCGYMHRGSQRQDTVSASMDYYRQRLDMIGEIFQSVMTTATNNNNNNNNVEPAAAAVPVPNKRILISGDSLMRQVFIGIACNAHSIFPQQNLIDDAVIPWQDPWPIIFGPNQKPSIGGGRHGGFGAASIRLVNGMEIHFVPHRGCNDPTTGEIDILERLIQDIDTYDGRITFGTKTAMPLSMEDHVDVFVYQVGIHYGLGDSRTMLNQFINRVSKPLMKATGNNRNNFILHDGYEEEQNDNNNDGRQPPPSPLRRTRIIYVTTPTQHYNTPTGQWEQNMTSQTLKCVDQIKLNPRAEQEKKMLKPGINVDVLLDYDDLNLGFLHVQNGDCSHYCMPGPPDGVAARLMQELLLV